MKRSKVAADELVALGQRVRIMQAFRLALALGVLVFAVMASETLDTGVLSVAKVTGAYLVLSLAAEGVWRGLGQRNLGLFGAMLIVDGVYLGWLVYVTGGPVSALLPLILLHLIAVTLLASHRTGLKLAMWHSLVLLAVYYGQEVRLAIPLVDERPALPTGGFARLVGFIAIFWLVALATTTFSAVNERELRRRRFDLEALARLAASLEGAESPPAVADTLLSSLIDTFNLSRGLVFGVVDVVSDPESSDGVVGEGILPVAALGGQGPGVATATGGIVGPADRAIRTACEARRTGLISDLDPEANPRVSNLLPNARNILVVPLTAEGRSVGAVVLEHGLRSGSRIERRVVSMVERFCSHAALALRNTTLVDQLRDLATTDGLTKVANRRTFETSLELELERAARTGGAVSLLMLDLDHFKRLNDEHGHRRGDEVLQGVAEILRRESRSFDVPARYGGEEFAVILPGCEVDDAIRSAERLRRAIAAMDDETPVTVSAGIATFPTHAADAESLVKTADRALYQSKRAGRNQVSMAPRELADEAAEGLSRMLDGAPEGPAEATSDPDPEPAMPDPGPEPAPQPAEDASPERAPEPPPPPGL
ncbi:MAG TPA: diguanylate cyclase [Actinomycetota bacterium]